MNCLAISVKYDKGEKEANILPHCGSCSIGMNTPLMKTRGNLTRDDNIIVVAGMSVGG